MAPRRKKKLTPAQQDRVRAIQGEVEGKLQIFFEQEVVPAVLSLVKETISDCVKNNG